jgi:hypothetical protein
MHTRNTVTLPGEQKGFKAYNVGASLMPYLSLALASSSAR